MLLAGVLGLYAPILDVPCLYGENNKKKKMTKSNKHHLHIEITSEQYVLLKENSKKTCLSIQEYIVRLIVRTKLLPL